MTHQAPTVEGPYLYLEVKKSRDCGDSWHIYPVRTENGKIRNYRSSSWENEPMSDLVIHAWFDKKEFIEKREERSALMHGWWVSYRDVFDIDEAKAAMMAKTLKAINKSLAQQTETYGNCPSFSAYVLRVAVAIKAKGFVTCSKNTSRGWSYDDSDHNFLNAKDAGYHIEQVHADYLKELFPESEVAA